MRRALLLLLAMLALHARGCSAASRQLTFIEYARQETAAALLAGFGTTAAVGMTTANPAAAMAAGVAAGTAASLTTGAFLEAYKQACMRTPGCTVPEAFRG